jgi:parallel beta-helix repeat protein
MVGAQNDSGNPDNQTYSDESLVLDSSEAEPQPSAEVNETSLNTTDLSPIQDINISENTTLIGEIILNETLANVTVNETLEGVSNTTPHIDIIEITTQEPAEVEVPVRWKKTVIILTEGNHTQVSLPASAFDVSVHKLLPAVAEVTGLEITRRGSSATLEEWEAQAASRISSADENVQLAINDVMDSQTMYEVDYKTPAPTKSEVVISDTKKLVTISSEMHYEEILVHTDIIDAPRNNIRVYWLVNDTNSELFTNLSYIDNDADGFIDELQWVVPHLSDQTFEVEIDILNVQSYPTVGGNWAVEFTTTGQADLTISAIDGTQFGVDLDFLSLKCGENVLNASVDDNSVFYPDYECNETGVETSQVLTEGAHHLMFQFGNATAYANNYAVASKKSAIINAQNVYYETSSCQSSNPTNWCAITNYGASKINYSGEMNFSTNSILSTNITSATVCMYKYFGTMQYTIYAQNITSISCSGNSLTSGLDQTNWFAQGFPVPNGWFCADVTQYVKSAIDNNANSFNVRFWGEDVGGATTNYDCFKGPAEAVANCGGSNPSGANNCTPYLNVTYDTNSGTKIRVYPYKNKGVYSTGSSSTYIYMGEYSNNYMIGLYAFNLSNYTGKSIGGAHFYCKLKSDVGARGIKNITAYKITSDWTEANATNLSKAPTYSTATAYGGTNIPDDIYGVYQWDVTDLVRAWLDGTVTNYGFLLRQVEIYDSTNNYTACYDRADATTTNRPYLEIYYADCLEPYDNLSITSSVTLCPGNFYINDSGDNGVLAVGGSSINITCNGTVIIGNTSGYGIYSSSKNNVVLKDCTFRNFSAGIYSSNSDGWRFNNITSVYSNSSMYTYGIFMTNSDSNNFTGCNFSANGIAMGVYTSHDNRIISSSIVGNYYYGIRSNSDRNYYYNNNFDGKAETDNLFYLYNTGADFTDNNTISNNTLTNASSTAIYIQQQSRNNNISDNTISYNSGYGIDFGTTAGNTLVWHNNFVNNGASIQAYNANSTNKFNYSTQYGNYWTHYDESSEGCTDTAPPGGICDSPLPYSKIDGDDSSTDNFPYVYRFNGDCIMPYDDLTLSQNTTLCPGTYYINDTGTNGVIRIGANNVSLSCNGTVIVGNDAGYGIYTNGLDYGEVEGCTFKNYSYGAYVSTNSDDWAVHDNTFDDNSNYGLLTWSSSNRINISNNQLINNGAYALYIGYAQNSIIRSNNVSNNGQGLIFYQSDYNNVTDNLFFGNTGVVIQLYADAEGNGFYDNTIDGDGKSTYGIYVNGQNATMNVSRNVIDSNSINNLTSFAIYFYDYADKNNITNNDIRDGSNYAIYIYNSSTRNTLIWLNNIENNGGNQIYHNGDASNQFNYSGDGNRWSHYDESSEGCNDTNADGICDAPLPYSKIDGSDVVTDNFPAAISADSRLLPHWPSEEYGLVGYWQLEGNGGGRFTNSVNSSILEGNCTGSVCNSKVTGYVGNAFGFQGTNGVYSEVDITNTSGFPTISNGNYAFEAWIKTNSSKENNTIFAFDTKDPSWYVKNGNKLVIYDGVSIESGTGVISDGNWHHVAFVREGTTTNQTKFYLDGTLLSVGTHSSSLVLPSILRIGSSGGTNDYFNGTIDEIRFYNRTLSSDEISLHYNTSKWGKFLFSNGDAGVSWIQPQYAVYDWHDKNGNSLALVNLQFEHGTSNSFVPDYSTYGHNSNSVGYDAHWNATGGVNGSGAFVFDGDGDYINLSMDSALTIGNGSYSLEAWVKTTSTNYYNTILSVNGGVLLFAVSGGDRLRIYNHGHIDSDTNLTMSDGNWRHLVFVRTGLEENQTEFYLDGVLVGLKTHENYIDATTELKVGASDTLEESFNGTIDNLRFYNYSLSAEQIKKNYEMNGSWSTIVKEEIGDDDEFSVNITHRKYGQWKLIEDDPACTVPVDGLLISRDTTLCPGTYLLADSGGTGVISFGDSNTQLYCDGTVMVGSYTGAVFLTGIYVSGYNNNTIRGCEIQNYDFGIYSYAADDTRIINNTLHDNNYGVASNEASDELQIQQNNVSNNNNAGILVSGNRNEIYNNVASNNGEYGIWAGGNDNLLSNNSASSNDEMGIYLLGSSNNLLTNNTMSNNGFTGISLQYGSNNNSVYDSVFSNNPLGLYVYYSSSNLISNTTVNGGIFGAYIGEDSDNNTLEHSLITSSDECLIISGTSNFNVIHNNTIFNCSEQGVEMRYGATNNEINENIIDGNGHYTNNCLEMYNDSNDNTIHDNLFYDCTKGVYLRTSTGNLFYYNNFTSNGLHVSAYEGNQFNVTVGGKAHGNYWDNIVSLNIFDSDGDGYGDSGSQYPYNSTNGGSVSSGVNDWGPITYNNTDTTPPGTVTNLNEQYTGTTWIYWSWTNPSDPGLNHVEVWLNGTFKQNVSAPINYYNATSLNSNTTYQIQTRTADNSGNINTTWVNDTATTRTVETQIDVYNLSRLNNISKYNIFEFLVQNMLGTTKNVSWKLNTSTTVIDSSILTSLTVSESVFVYVEYNYSSGGTYEITSYANSTIYDDQGKITIVV